MLVYIDSKKPGEKRELVEVEVIKMKKTKIVVRLPDGNIIERKKSRDLPKTDGSSESIPIEIPTESNEVPQEESGLS